MVPFANERPSSPSSTPIETLIMKKVEERKQKATLMADDLID
jgi:hypothetical protein